ncbi:MAG: hypothetical protein KDK37_02465 [Leptospiraceae bacterium]|nr:hypothetical protein [Leptospiraceae bacterium]
MIGIRNSLLILCIFATWAIGCSSVTSHYSLEPETRNGWQPDPNNDDRVAVFSGKGFYMRISVPISGSTQHFVGPCLLPIIPKTKEWPQPLQIQMYIRTDNGAKPQLRANDWIVHLRSRDMEGAFGNEVFKDTTPVRIDGPVKEGDGWSATLAFSEYDNMFIDFRLQGGFGLSGQHYTIPDLVFERNGNLDYTPYTTKILDM